MITQTFTRAGNPPHAPTLGDAIRSLVPGSFYVQWRPGFVDLAAADWTGVNLNAVQTQVTAAPDDTPEQQAVWASTHLGAAGVPLDLTLVKAAFLVALDQVNALRAFHSLAAVTPAQFAAAVKNRAATL